MAVRCFARRPSISLSLSASKALSRPATAPTENREGGGLEEEEEPVGGSGGGGDDGRGGREGEESFVNYRCPLLCHSHSGSPFGVRAARERERETQ